MSLEQHGWLLYFDAAIIVIILVFISPMASALMLASGLLLVIVGVSRK